MTVNNRAKTPKHTEQDIVLAPAYWQHFLEPKLEDSVCKQNRSLKSDFTSVVVSVTQRCYDPYHKQDSANGPWGPGTSHVMDIRDIMDLH
jgi:hypothetical protein